MGAKLKDVPAFRKPFQAKGQSREIIINGVHLR